MARFTGVVGLNASTLAKVVGLCSTVGGLAWVGACLVHNSLPQGCIDEGCAVRPMRGSTPADVILFLMAGLMLAASGIGLLLLVQSGSGLGRTGIVAGAAGAAGCLLLGSAFVVSTLVDDNWNDMPGLVVPGVLLLAVGLVLVAVVVLRARVVPTWCALLLLATALLLPFANEQTSRVLLAVPFGLCWMVAGVVAMLRSVPVPARV